MKKQFLLSLLFILFFAAQAAIAQQSGSQPVSNQTVTGYPVGVAPQPIQYPTVNMPGQPPIPATPPAGTYYYQQQQHAPVMVPIFSGTPIELETIYPLNGKQLSQGQTVDMRVKYDIIVNGYKVISAGAPARVVVSAVEKSKMFGKAGEIQLLPQYVQTVDGQFLPVSGMPSNFEGKGRKGLAWGGVAAGALTGGIGFLALPFVKGKQAEVPVGTTLMCSVLGERMIPVIR
ncbi:hypothetical protein [Flavilitoribacter nigricans]|uniref:TrbI/VirB10 family protein n=1 Tax=Flavilitoribacter nigricans (strain ATCC 23147 / DSM 23189 / NBRC 102662 / NCIMB 1420 / SS-2) TaxID=1122177 RepID=A0A2D0N1F7_FLAN2|nr:hypothetical protein [Flavilitoribacter nigricans]PHN01969.1 hypothetical protein CRP01_34250 [Flavilitoribacter nigricans DSM 23189 = NBRC 102662]